jgi:hypothetical protein
MEIGQLDSQRLLMDPNPGYPISKGFRFGSYRVRMRLRAASRFRARKFGKWLSVERLRELLVAEARTCFATLSVGAPARALS